MRRVSAEVYADLGDYGLIIPSWLDHPGVLSYVDLETTRRGFVLLGFYEPTTGTAGTALPGASGEAYVADLLALAVDPPAQRQGVGRRLLGHAIAVAELASRHGRVSELRLTVAEGNAVGLRLYQQTGFQVLDEDHGSYDGGQRAIRMVRALRSPGAVSVG
jgi:ribosomal protein S18 acetylase RimI-like enzyme